MATSPSTRRPARKAARKQTYYEPESDDDFGSTQTPRTQPRRSVRRQVTYESSDDSDEHDTSDDVDSSEDLDAASDFESGFRRKVQPLTPTSPIPVLRSRRLVRSSYNESASPCDSGFPLSSSSQRKSGKPSSDSKRRKLNNGKKATATSYQNASAPIQVRIPAASSTDRIPPWQSLEHQILVRIMSYAAPMSIDKPDSTSVRWLLNTSEMCLSFHDACITTLLHSPPLLPAHRAHWLINLLKASARDYGDLDNQNADRQQPINLKKLSLDYRRKVKHLNIEVKQLLIKKRGINLLELLALTPLLNTLRLYHNHDIIYSNHLFAQPMFAKDKWSYGDTLFDTLDQLNIRLKCFEWNGRFLKNDPSIASLPRYHMRPCLRDLVSLTIRNLDVKNVEKDVDVLVSVRANLLEALKQLDKLESLSFDRCNVLDSATITSVPCLSLNELVVTACPYVTTDGIHAYLERAGHNLKRFVLTGNQVLSLAFLSNLKDLCPKLEEITIDLNFHDPTSFKDTEPLFDDLLPNGPPTWPVTLRSISVGPLRALSAQDAEGFYASLTDAADELPYLRSLVVKTILNDISWRDRAKMRSKWLALFNDVFALESGHDPAPAPAPQPSNDSDTKSPSKRKSARLHELEVQSMPSTPEAVTGDGLPLKRQNRCNTVIFELSDQRPAQDQYNEEDFLDDEPSDDAEWDGKDQNLVPTYSARRYAW